MIITGGKYKGRKIKIPESNIARPTLSQVRMGVFNTLYSLIGDFSDKSFLDVFGGSGIMGIEALSRGFYKTVVCEKNPDAVRIIKANYNMLGIQAYIRIGDCINSLKKINTAFDVIYIDPPYKSGIYEEVFNNIKYHENSIIIAEHSEILNIKNFELLKQKKYSGKFLSYFKQSN